MKPNEPTFKEWARLQDLEESNEELIQELRGTFLYQRYELGCALRELGCAILPAWLLRWLGVKA